MKKIKDDTKRWRDVVISEESICENDYNTPIYRFNAIPIKLPIIFFKELGQKSSQFVWKHKRPPTGKAFLGEKSGAGGIRLLDFRLYYKATVLKTVCTGTKTEIRPMEQDRKPKDNLCTYGHLIVDKGGKNIQWRKDSLFSKWFW